MANLDLTKYGITGATVIAHNPSYEQLFEEETKAGLEVLKLASRPSSALSTLRLVSTPVVRLRTSTS